MQSASSQITQEPQTREIILQAAFDEIHTRGFQAASLTKILSSTNLTKGALYHYFPTKLDLGYAVVDELIAQQINTQWIEPINQAENPITAFIQIIIQAGEEVCEEDIQVGCPLNNLAQEMAPIDEGFRSRVEKIYEMWRQGIEKAFVQGQKNGVVNKDINVKSVAIMIVASLEGCMGLAKNAQSKKVLYQCGQSVMDYLNSLRA